MTAASFNELFGLGSHSADANLKGWWPMLDNAANTTVLDQSSGGHNGTLLGGDNTSVLATTGPNNWLTSCLKLNGVDDNISFALSAMSSDDLTWLAKIKLVNDPPTVVTKTGFGFSGEAVSGFSSASHYIWTDSNIYNSTWRGSDASTTSRVTVGNPTPALTSWRDVCIKTTPGANGWRFRIDGSSIATATGITGVYTGGNWRLGWSTNGSTNYYLDGYVSHFSIFNRLLSDAEESDAFAGPEPINTAAPSLSGTETQGQVLTCSSGTWGLDSPFSGGSNGTITYSYQWTRSNDGSGSGEANIGGATSSTYTLQAVDVGKYIRCWVRASNDGGYDVAADAASGFTGAIASSGGTAKVPYHHLFGSCL